ncbi:MULTISPECIES: class I SAM-dependent methyltransferase [unclassified Novosphingobium]|uniref:class I SAM-dependent methyltransferase n=1 Tax=unclassified Novosphingobium TaxID=2644732 RepID=UPI0025F2E3A1|nr:MULTISPECIES: class I SAM-dependent methyltransferase [unclassified Novosphingobium]HQV03675.1 class I SAM-dependent methyltransferase [Novosphingobium sp.]
MTTGSDWQDAVGRTWAENYRLTDRAFAGLTERLLARIGGCEGQGVLDIGCGAGELSLAVARGNHSAEVVGVDVSSDLVEAARQRAAGHTNVRFELADAGSWRPGPFRPDKLISRHGVMFFDAPRAAFAHLRQIASPGAELVFSCFRSPKLNAWASELASLLELPGNADPTAPGPFAFADEAHVRSVLGDAGWQDIAMAETDFAYVAGVGEDPVADAVNLFTRIGPAAPALRALDGDARERALGWIRDWLEQHRSGNLVALGAAAWIVTAKA